MKFDYDQEQYEKAQKRLKDIKGFYRHLFIFSIVIIILVFINLKYTPEVFWFIWVIIGSGIPVLIHGIKVFKLDTFFNAQCKENKLNEILEKENVNLSKVEKLNNNRESANNLRRSNMMNDEIKYQEALKRVKKIKGFYTHSIVYLVINIMIVIINIQNLKDGESYFQVQNFFTAFFWGIGLLAHGLSVFLPDWILGQNWEDRKINELMEKEKANKWE